MKMFQLKGLAGIANLLGLSFLAIALILALTAPSVSAAPAAQGTATTTTTATVAATAAATATSPAPAATSTTTAPSTLPTTGGSPTGDASLALGLLTLAGLGFLGVGLALRAFAPTR